MQGKSHGLIDQKQQTKHFSVNSRVKFLSCHEASRWAGEQASGS